MSSKEEWTKLKKRLNRKKVFAGFDGYIDLLYSVVQKETGGEKQIYRHSREFAQSLLETSGKSSEYEILLKSRRVGGNAPLMSIGMAAMGVSVCCAGAFEEQTVRKIKGVPGSVAKNLKLYSAGNPAVTIALEFEDCKYMLADCKALQDITYKKLEEKIGKKELGKKILEADLIAAVNWAALPGLKGILEKYIFSKEAVENYVEGLSSKWLFLDLSDIRKKEADELQAYFCTIAQAARHTGFRTCLSLNENELRVLADKLGIAETSEEQMLQEIRAFIKIEEVILHAMEKSVYCSDGTIEEVPKKICRHPVITTGAGDNFNAGVCVGKLLEFPPRVQIEMGNSAAEYYVTYGHSGNLEDILNWKRR